MNAGRFSDGGRRYYIVITWQRVFRNESRHSQNGNSQGILIPKPVLARVGLEDEAIMTVEDRALVLRPVRRPAREGWAEASTRIAEAYALRRDPDNMFKWLDQAWANRDSGIQYLTYDPMILRYQHDPRFAAFCKKIGLPTTTDAKALP
jgi:antitoxin component of MazEF toxin-antitoxin module